jgi:hypothetical protein
MPFASDWRTPNHIPVEVNGVDDNSSLEPTDEAWMLEIQHALEELASMQTLIQLIQEVGKQTGQLGPWAILILTQLQKIHSSSDRIMRRIIIDMVQAQVINQPQAAEVSGYSRTSIHNWLKDLDDSSLSP